MTKTLREYIEQAELNSTSDIIEAGDDFILELAEDTALETYVLESWDDSILLAVDAVALDLLESHGCKFNDATSLKESKKDYCDSCDQKIVEQPHVCPGTEDVSEAEYQGRKVALGKPMKGDVKKSKVYVRKPNGKVVKVNFGDKKLSIKKHIPGRRKNFRARHNCANPGPRWKARYWSCRAW